MKIPQTIFVLSLVVWAMARIILSIASFMLWATFHKFNIMKLFTSISFIDSIVGIASIILCLLFIFAKTRLTKYITIFFFSFSALTLIYIIYMHFVGPYKHGHEGIGQVIALILFLILQLWIYIAVSNKIKIKRESF